MRIIGLHNGHDASVTLMEDGKLIYHWELERFNGIKHFIGITTNALGDFLTNYVLPKLNLRRSDIDIICFSGLYYVPDSYRGDPGKYSPLEMKTAWLNSEFQSIIGNQFYSRQHPYVEWCADWYGQKTKFFASLHHLNHSAYAYFTSPFNDAVVLTYDGCGDFQTTTTAALGHQNKIKITTDLEVNPPYGVVRNQIGYAYQTLNKIFNFFGDDLATAGQAMALASYGEVDDSFKKLCWEYITTPFFKKKTNELKEIFSKEDSKSKKTHDFLATFQNVIEQYVLTLVSRILSQHSAKNICVSGGCALNVLVNSKLREAGYAPYIPPACSDSGQSIGACLYYWHDYLNNPYVPNWHNPFLGDTIQLSNLKPSRIFDSESDLVGFTAQKLAEGKIVAWAQGRCEIGPRALGNRSIFCSPQYSNIPEVLNTKIKFRDWWRPYAPVCLLEDVSDWFLTTIEHPYMLEAPKVRIDKADIIPAVVHVDQSARLQTVIPSQNPLLHLLLSEFKKITNIPILLNTSLNKKGQPICNYENSIIQLLNSTAIDLAIIENRLFEKTAFYL